MLDNDSTTSNYFLTWHSISFHCFRFSNDIFSIAFLLVHPSAHVGIRHLGDRGDGPDAVGLEGRVLDDLRARVSAGRHLPPLKLDVRPHAPPVQFLHRADVVGEGRLWLLQVSSGVLKRIFRKLPYIANKCLYKSTVRILWQHACFPSNQLDQIASSMGSHRSLHLVALHEEPHVLQLCARDVDGPVHDDPRDRLPAAGQRRRPLVRQVGLRRRQQARKVHARDGEVLAAVHYLAGERNRGLNRA